MADILYKILYDDDNGFRREQHVVAIGTSPDRIAFVTDAKTIAHLKKEGKKGKKPALKRNHSPFRDGAMKDPYILSTSRKFFEVATRGGLNGFRMECGEVDNETGKFRKWTKKEAQGKKKGKGTVVQQANPSLPFPT
jgi:hypothetical protein